MWQESGPAETPRANRNPMHLQGFSYSSSLTHRVSYHPGETIAAIAGLGLAAGQGVAALVDAAAPRLCSHLIFGLPR